MGILQFVILLLPARSVESVMTESPAPAENHQPRPAAVRSLGNVRFDHRRPRAQRY
jgi:hypothetical protein